MDVKFDFLIESEAFSVDMKTGLESLQGVSDTFRLIGEALLTDDVADRKTHRNDVRTNLEKNFKGSYGQIFSLEPHDKNAILALKKMGKDTFAELINYFLSEALYEESINLSDQAKEVLEGLSSKTLVQLMKKLRSPLRKLHRINRAFGYNLQVRYRKYASDPIVLQKFNHRTYEALEAVQTKETVEIRGAITRINIKNGNGRIKIYDETNTLAFGFGKAFESLSTEVKKIFSSNLDGNMGINQEYWEYLNLIVHPVKLGDGSIVKYVFKEFA